jgi:cell division protein FtsL
MKKCAVKGVESMRRAYKHNSWLNAKGKGVLLVVVALFFVGFARQGYKIYQVKQETIKTEVKVKELQEKKDKLQQEKENLGDLHYIEKIAREELNMVRKGEIPLFIVKERNAEQSAEDKGATSNK